MLLLPAILHYYRIKAKLISIVYKTVYKSASPPHALLFILQELSSPHTYFPLPSLPQIPVPTTGDSFSPLRLSLGYLFMWIFATFINKVFPHTGICMLQILLLAPIILYCKYPCACLPPFLTKVFFQLGLYLLVGGL